MSSTVTPLSKRFFGQRSLERFGYFAVKKFADEVKLFRHQSPRM